MQHALIEGKRVVHIFCWKTPKGEIKWVDDIKIDVRGIGCEDMNWSELC
jgi:hypothetical protein